MLKSHEKFHSANGKRLVLIVDDEEVNQQILGNILHYDYEVIYASNGKEALEKIRKNAQILSLILLDLLMPEISGLELLKIIKADPSLSHIPVMVLTSEKDAEVESLKLGASDFLIKPYNQPIVMARVMKTIELSEDREIIQSTERDPLTGLYNRDYFFIYADQYDHFHEGQEMDAIVVDINHFHMINERYGKEYGDTLLKAVGEKLKESVQEEGGIVCRRLADTFMIYCPCRDDYQEILDHATEALKVDREHNSGTVSRLRMGVYRNCDRSIDIERRFDRANLAANRLRHDFSTSIAFYDKTLHDAQIYSERLIEGFSSALEANEFKVYYQPKFDIRPEQPILSSAEALVRWANPELGFINPGVFIPLFEDNGLIQQLDYFVWETAAAQIKDWKERYGLSVPISVNVSRVDMYDRVLMDKLKGLIEKYDLEPEELALEITESAYTEDSDQIIKIVENLREMGFRIEMDDFGTGYSSLNMISTLPIDVLKIDMLFIRGAFNMHKDVRMLELIMDIADYISVPVIAEGVETEEQMEALKSLGCDFVQGYYFSKPVPPEEFDHFLEEKKIFIEEQAALLGEEYEVNKETFLEEQYGHISYISIAHALSSSFETIYYVNLKTDHYVELVSQGRYGDLKVQKKGADFFGDVKKNIPEMISESDQSKVSWTFEKNRLISRLNRNNKISLNYHLLLDGEPYLYNCKVAWVDDPEANHVVIGISNIDERVRVKL